MFYQYILPPNTATLFYAALAAPQLDLLMQGQSTDLRFRFEIAYNRLKIHGLFTVDVFLKKIFRADQ